jgi:hypothetical protein
VKVIDIRARINRRALECPDAAAFPDHGPVGQDGGITTVVERMVTIRGPAAKVVYLADQPPRAVRQKR